MTERGMEERTRLEDWLDYFFRAPFKGLPLLAWCYFLLCFLAVSSSPILHGSFPDPDDYTYLTKAMDLIHGQGWYDAIQHRMNAPEGTFIHYSNILAIFYAWPIMMLTPLFGEIGAATFMAAIMPLFYAVLFFSILRRVTAFFVGEKWARVSAFVALFATTAMFQFTPGHIDHHGLEIILVLTSVWACLHMFEQGQFEQPVFLKWPLLAGFILALSLAIALEVLPVFMLITAWVGVWSAVKGGRAAYAGLVFGGTLFIASIMFLLLTRDYTRVFDIEALSYSVVYVAMVGGAFLCFAAVAILARAPVALRCAAAALVAAVFGGAFLHYFPALKTGPYGAMDPALAKLMFDNISEALPIIRGDAPLMVTIIALLWPVMAVATALYFMWKERKQNLWAWGLLSILIVATSLLAAFYQLRFMGIAQAFAIPALTVLLRAGLDMAERKHSGCFMCAMRAGMVLVVSVIPMVWLPAMVDGRSFNPGVMFYLNQTSNEDRCDLQIVSDMLAMPTYYGAKPHVIMNMINHGPELMFRTPHIVLSAPYHLNVSGNIDAMHFFSTANADEAHDIARRRGVELVLMCRAYADLYATVDKTAVNAIDENGKVEDTDKSFARQLADNKVPDWLKPVDYPLFGKIMLFEVREPGAKDAPQDAPNTGHAPATKKHPEPVK